MEAGAFGGFVCRPKPSTLNRDKVNALETSSEDDRLESTDVEVQVLKLRGEVVQLRNVMSFELSSTS